MNLKAWSILAVVVLVFVFMATANEDARAKRTLPLFRPLFRPAPAPHPVFFPVLHSFLFPAHVHHAPIYIFNAKPVSAAASAVTKTSAPTTAAKTTLPPTTTPEPAVEPPTLPAMETVTNPEAKPVPVFPTLDPVVDANSQ